MRISRKMVVLLSVSAALSLAASGCKSKKGQPGQPDDLTGMRGAEAMGAAMSPARRATPERPAPRRVKPLPKGEIAAPTLWLTVDTVKKECDGNLAAARKMEAAILAVKGPRTLKNTLEPYNRIQIHLDRILPEAELISNVHPDKAVRTAAEKCERKAKKYVSELKLNRKLYDAVKSVDVKGLDAAAQRFVKLLLRDYRRSGVDKDKKTRDKLAALDAKMVKLGQTFARNIREDKRSMEVTEKDLEGMPADWLKSRAAKKTKAGKIKVTTDYPDFFPIQSYAKHESLRKALYQKFLSRAYPANDTVFKQLLQARYDYATTLGYSDWAAYNAEDKMVKTKKTIADFIDRVANLARPRMKTDLKELLARKRKDDPKAKVVQQWDRFYYVKKIQAERFGVNPSEVRAYFDFRKVKAGLLAINQALWHVRFQRAKNAKVWHPSVEAYDVFDGDQQIARFYLDLHPRKGKYGHAAEFPIYSGVTGVQLPSASLVTNFPDPARANGGPALMEHSQVTTFFHEFGHLMHQLLAGHHKWVAQSGISCEWDFVEAPSQLMEEWPWDPQVLARFAKHYKTGKPIPASLVKKMRAADEFGKGVNVMRQMFYAALSFTYHDRNPKGMDLLKTLLEVQKKYSPYPYQPGTHSYDNFGHLNGYSSMYYTYMWSLVLAKDLFTRFKAKGLMDKATALDYRRKILAPGGSKDAADLVKDFLGRPYSFDAYSHWLKR